MKKLTNVNYINLVYLSTVGYTLLIQSKKSESVRVTFYSIEDVQEYLEAKVGKVLSRGFNNYFEEIKQIIVNQTDLGKQVISPYYMYKDGIFQKENS